MVGMSTCLVTPLLVTLTGIVAVPLEPLAGVTGKSTIVATCWVTDAVIDDGLTFQPSGTFNVTVADSFADVLSISWIGTQPSGGQLPPLLSVIVHAFGFGAANVATRLTGVACGLSNDATDA